MAAIRQLIRPLRCIAVPQATRAFSTTIAARAKVSNAPAPPKRPLSDLKVVEPRPRTDDANVGEQSVGEMEGIEFKIEPMRRVGEDDNTMRARLVCKSCPLRS
jgi:succinate dehydrogenase assembly factor 2